MEDRVLLYVMNVLGRPKGSYLESFMLIFFLDVCQEWGVLYVGTCRTLRVPDLEDRFIYDFMEVLGRPQGSDPEVSCQYLY